FGGLADNSNQPIDIESDSLEVLDAKNIAIFRGNVKAVQGSMVLRSRELHVKYTQSEKRQAGASAPAASGGTQITTIDAKGPVIITTADSQTVTSDWALFDVQQQLVTIGGNVVLTQGENVIKGDRLIIDLKTGRSRVEYERDPTTGKRPRVKGLFIPKKSGQQDKPQ
ncbi:MAG: LPS ABC transporter substrate-binding protein LptA, partial [Alphaproteobacteria bacterium]